LVLDTPAALKDQVGEGDVVEIHFDTPLDGDKIKPALDSLVSHVYIATQNKSVTVRALNAVGKLPAILSALEDIDYKASDVRVRENTLEDVFIQLTGRRLRE
jgi:ABC-2 type transport system ATP-binding protein